MDVIEELPEHGSCKVNSVVDYIVASKLKVHQKLVCAF